MRSPRRSPSGMRTISIGKPGPLAKIESAQNDYCLAYLGVDLLPVRRCPSCPTKFRSSNFRQLTSS